MAKRVMTPVKMIECDQVRGFRIKLGMTQKEFADATGLAASTIKKIETYKTSVTYKSKTCISEYLENNGFPCEWYDADVNGDADVYTAVSGLMQGNSAYILEISDCIEEIISTESFKKIERRRQYVEFVAATMKEYRDICKAEALAIKRNSKHDLKQEVDSFRRAVMDNAESIYEKNNAK